MSVTLFQMIFSLILFVFSVIRYFLRWREVKVNNTGTFNRVDLVLKYIISIFLILVIILFGMNLNLITETPDLLQDILAVNISIFSLSKYFNSNFKAI